MMKYGDVTKGCSKDLGHLTPQPERFAAFTGNIRRSSARSGTLPPRARAGAKRVNLGSQ